MSNIAIRVEALSKRYRIGAAVVRHQSLREALTHLARAPLQNLTRLRRLSSFGEDDTEAVIWALRDVSFEVRHGEVLGVIGRNGAGKSTLLKLLSRITAPTSGRAEVYGRVGSLLEVGTGFHPELTGRDNVYLNGSILGMDRRYIDGCFDQIVEFAGVVQFIDTPVKRYSSGMYLRLAFSVAAHLEPEVLIVDEVLAVGDAEFQQKCLGRMDEVAREGRTVLFVSHNMNAIQRLCSRSILLAEGRISAVGPTLDIVERYLSTVSAEASPAEWIDLGQARRSGSGSARFERILYRSSSEKVGLHPHAEGPLEVLLTISASATHEGASIALNLSDRHGTKLVNADTDNLGSGVTLPNGRSTWRFTIDRLYLRPGTYVLGLWLAGPHGEVLDRIESALLLEIADLQTEQVGVRLDPRYAGHVVCHFSAERVVDAPTAEARPQFESMAPVLHSA